jgi:hypothetical protein
MKLESRSPTGAQFHALDVVLTYVLLQIASNNVPVDHEHRIPDSARLHQ